MSISQQLGERKEVRLRQGSIRYRERGTGDPIVFVHGVLTNGDLWRNVVPPLARNHRCITPDWPLGSHDQPMDADADLTSPGLAALVAEFLTALDLDEVTLVGNDTGGAVCQLVATGPAERVGRLVLTSCDAYEAFPPRPFAFLRWLPSIPGGVYLAAKSLQVPFLRRLPTGYGLVVRRPFDEAIARSFADPAGSSALVRRDIAKVLRGASSRYTLEAARRFPQFDRPVLVAWARDDRLFPRSLAERLVADFPRARLEIIDDSRTFTPEDQPEKLAALISAFLEDCSRTGRDARAPRPRLASREA